MNKTMKVLMFCLVLFLPLPSYAGRLPPEFIEKVGYIISTCFHPTASYSSIDLPYFPEFDVDDRITEGRGKIYFNGGLTGNSYYMSFIIQSRSPGDAKKGIPYQYLVRIIPQVDTAPFPPNPNCALRDWTNFGELTG